MKIARVCTINELKKLNLENYRKMRIGGIEWYANYVHERKPEHSQGVNRLRS